MNGWDQKVLQGIERAEKEEASQRNDAARMADFNPRGRLGYLPLHQQHLRDTAMTGQSERMDSMHSVFRSTGREVILPRGRRADANGRVQNARVLVGDNPVATIENAIGAMVEDGARHVFMDIATHGEDGLYFSVDATRNVRVTYTQLMDIFKRFPTVFFTVMTIACQGGWGGNEHQNFQNILRDVPGAPEGRVTIITQTKPDRSNWTGNPYPEYFAYYTAMGFPPGRAHQEADTQVRIQSEIGLNPEVHRSSPAGGLGPTYNARDERPQDGEFA